MWLHPRQWPWWGWVIAGGATLLGLLLSAGLAYRQTSLTQLKSTIAKLQAAGRPALPGDFLALAPAVDAERQDHLWRIISDTSGTWRTLHSTDGMDARYANKNTQKKVALDSETILVASKSIRSQWRALHRSGPVVISGFGWPMHQAAEPTSIGLEEAAGIRLPNLLSLRSLSIAIATDSRLSPDPLPALQDLDALIKAMERPATLIDAMIAIALLRTSDSAWLEATVRGIDPTQWVQSMPRPFDLVADGFIGERALANGGLAQDALYQRGWGSWRGPPGDFSQMYAFSGSSSPWSRAQFWTQGKLMWFTCPGDADFLLRYHALAEDHCRTGIDLTKPLAARLQEPLFGNLHPVSRMMIMNGSMAETSANAELSARIYRLAGCVVRHWQKEGVLPDPTEWSNPAAKHLLAAFPLTPALVYKNLTDTRFRIIVDPAAPSSPLTPTTPTPKLASPSRPWSTGHTWLELDLSEKPH